LKSLVTGGAGFIGSHLVDALFELGDEVIVLDNLSTGRLDNLAHLLDNISFINCDLSSRTEWSAEFENVDRVFHLAALADIVPSIKNPGEYYRSNVDGTFNVLEASRRAGIDRFVYVASSSSYGIPRVYPTPEDAGIDPQYPYALTKYMGEELVLFWSQLYNLPTISLRLFNVYGPRSRTSGSYGAVFGVFLAQKLAGRPYTVVGDGQQTRDFTFVSDIVAALIAASTSEKSGRAYNVGSGRTVSINHIVNLLGGDKEYIPKRPGEPDCTFADISRIAQEIGWKPLVSIEEGVTELLKDLAYWKDAPVWTSKSISEVTEDWFKYLGPVIQD
jgi:UDP-glucose 4-epimerase